VAALVAACQRPVVPPREVVLGASLPLSGTEAADGSAMRQGYQRAVDEANAAGGLQLAASATTTRVHLEVLDDRAETPLAEEHVAALIKGGVHVLLGTQTAVRAGVQAMIAEREQRPYVANGVDAAGLPGKRMSWVFSVPVTGQDLESRAYETAKAALAAVSRAGALDAAHLRIALGGL
jgi:branched-chain amino acid transport system substrate-binding protein